MDSTEFEKYVREIVAQMESSRTETKAADTINVFIVWMCKTLQNNKALASAPGGYYYELTYNGDKGEMYVDVYAKLLNKKVTFYTKS